MRTAIKHSLWIFVLVAAGGSSCAEKSTVRLPDESIENYFDEHRHHAPLILNSNGESPLNCWPSPSWGELFPEEPNKEFEQLFLYKVGETTKVHPALNDYPLEYVFTRASQLIGLGQSELQLYAAPWGGDATIICDGEQVFESTLVIMGAPQIGRVDGEEGFDRAARKVEEHGLLPVLDDDLAYDVPID